MPKPVSGFQYDRFLQDWMVGYRNDELNLAHLQIPTVPAMDETGLFPVFSQADWLRLEVKPRAKSSEAAMSGYGITSGTFQTKPYGFKQPVDIDDAARALDPVDLDLAAAGYVADQFLMQNESDLCAAMFVAGTWIGSTDQGGVAAAPGANQFVFWGATAATPGKNVAAVASSIKKNTGKTPNVLVVTDDVDAALRYCPDVVNRVLYVNANAIDSKGSINASALAQYFGVKKYIVAGGTQNTAKEGQTATMAFFASNNAWLGYIDMGGALDQPMTMSNAKFRPSALAAIRYQIPGGTDGKRVRSYFDNRIKSNVVEGDQSFVYKQMALPLGAYFANVLS